MSKLNLYLDYISKQKGEFQLTFTEWSNENYPSTKRNNKNLFFLILLLLPCMIGCRHDNDSSSGNNVGQGSVYSENNNKFPIAPVPEPPTLILSGLGLLGFYIKGRLK